MLSPADLHPYQLRAIDHILNHSRSMLWMSMGTGKSICALTALNFWLGIGEIRGTLIVAPLRVCHTVWGQEAKKWAHTRHLTVSYILGSPSERTAALLEKSDIYLINYENLDWLHNTLQKYFIKRRRPLPFDTLVLDEVTKVKNISTKRFGTLWKMREHFPARIGLTGTPASNGLVDLHGQFRIIDDGVRLGLGKIQFKDRFFYKMGLYRLVPFPDSRDKIKKLVSDITIQIDSSDLKLKEAVVNDVVVELPPAARKAYDEMESEFFTQLEGGPEIEIFNLAAKTNKLLQIANGNVYSEDGVWHAVHDAKLEALDEIMDETGDDPILLSYAYRSDATRIMKRYPEAVNLTTVRASDLVETIAKWNRGDIRLMIGHPASMGHGLNLQAGGSTLVWYGLNWSLDLYLQFNARLDRQGQEETVICHRILAKDTMDFAVKEALDLKARDQSQLQAALRAYRETKK